MSRLGRVVEVTCQSTDFFQYVPTIGGWLADYVISAFKNHEAFALNPSAVFTFYAKPYDSWSVTAAGGHVDDVASHVRKLNEADAGPEVDWEAEGRMTGALVSYVPEPPAELFEMHLDQLIDALEDRSESGFNYGPPVPRLGTGPQSVRAGKNNFVIDPEGWLIVGMTGHQMLSGGGLVGGAGHLALDDAGVVNRVETNFSGHYRPRLSGDYVRYVFRTVVGHPLLRVSANCGFAGRAFKGMEAAARALEFTREEILEDSDRLDLWIESYL